MQRNKLDIIYSDAAEVIKSVDFSSLKGNSVLVTGATGQIGTHFLAVLALLKSSGMSIKVYGYCHSEPEEHTKEIAQGGEYLYFFLTSTSSQDIDAIIHLAGYAQPSRFTCNPAETIRINVEWTRQLLHYLKPTGKFLFASSSEVYSGLTTADESQIGTTNPYHSRAGYIEGKRAGEAVVNSYRLQGVEARSARLSLVYGPGARRNDSRAVSTFIDQALKDNLIQMKYAGDDPRTFCYISDAVEMMCNILLHGKEPVYNVGSPSSYTIERVSPL